VTRSEARARVQPPLPLGRFKTVCRGGEETLADGEEGICLTLA
jgi:hypothetical protein